MITTGAHRARRIPIALAQGPTVELVAMQDSGR
jgi:hypothetical protein